MYREAKNDLAHADEMLLDAMWMMEMWWRKKNLLLLANESAWSQHDVIRAERDQLRALLREADKHLHAAIAAAKAAGVE